MKMSDHQSRTIPIEGQLDIISARVEGREMARALGFDAIDQARIATAISELAHNVVLYAEGGQITLRQISAHRGGKGLEIVCQDRGPGISDLSLALQDGYSTSGRLGTGLPGVRRLMDEFEVQSEPNVGTTVIVKKWLSCRGK
jgi:serine/threonine-protein kinase RsbT